MGAIGGKFGVRRPSDNGFRSGGNNGGGESNGNGGANACLRNFYLFSHIYFVFIYNM